MIKEELEKKLAGFLNLEIELVLKENKSVFLNVLNKSRKKLKLSLHSCFLEASEEVVKALCIYCINKDKNALSFIRNFVYSHFLTVDYSDRLKKRVLITKGSYYDLNNAFDDVSQKYFEPPLDLSITWFNLPKYTKSRHITFGSFDRIYKLIRINKILDNPNVPSYFLSFIVYHEILHYIYPIELGSNQRKRIHHKLFKEKEKSFCYYPQAKAWEKEFLNNFKRNINVWS